MYRKIYSRLFSQDGRLTKGVSLQYLKLTIGVCALLGLIWDDQYDSLGCLPWHMWLFPLYVNKIQYLSLHVLCLLLYILLF